MRNSCIGSLYALDGTVAVHVDLVYMGRTVTLLNSQCLGNSLCMVDKVTLSFVYKCCMMVISAYAKPNAWVAENFSFILKRPHRIITYHITDTSISRIPFLVRIDKVRAVGIIIFPVIFEDSAVLKHAGGVNFFCLSLDTDHVLAQFCYSCRLRIVLLAIGNAAPKVNVCAAVIVHKHCRVKAPYHALASRRLSSDQSLANGIFPWAYRAVAFQYSNTGSVICKIQEEFIFSFDLLIGNGRRPCMAGPLCRTLSPIRSCHVNFPMICPVHQICGRYDPEGSNVAEIVRIRVLLVGKFIIVCRHVHIYPAVIDNGIGVCTKFMSSNWISIAQLLRQRLSIQVFQSDVRTAGIHIIIHCSAFCPDVVCADCHCLIFVHITFGFQFDRGKQFIFRCKGNIISLHCHIQSAVLKCICCFSFDCGRKFHILHGHKFWYGNGSVQSAIVPRRQFI